jgi:hypothetical protein
VRAIAAGNTHVMRVRSPSGYEGWYEDSAHVGAIGLASSPLALKISQPGENVALQ